MDNKVFIAETTHIVMPSDTNHHGTLFGGMLAQWIDICAALSAQKCAGSVVTASIDNLVFKNPVKLGDVVTLRSAVNRVWDTSMEVGVRVVAQSNTERGHGVQHPQLYYMLDEERLVCTAYLTFVAIDTRGLRRKINLPDKDKVFTDDIIWWNRWNEAEKRRKQRLENK